jgi:hypothetical protein
VRCVFRASCSTEASSVKAGGRPTSTPYSPKYLEEEFYSGLR